MARKSLGTSTQARRVIRYIGVDRHRQLLVAYVIEVRNGALTVIERVRWTNRQIQVMLKFLQQQRPFEVVIEATEIYDWFAEFCEPLAERVGPLRW